VLFCSTVGKLARLCVEEGGLANYMRIRILMFLLAEA
jgi:hypothetical protein